MAVVDELVSVVIPVFNGERFLAQAIDSVRRQTHAPLEVIVVDDGSTDRSLEIARSIASVRLVHQENAGQAAARNRGAAMATGRWLAFLDADDLWLPEKLELQMATLQATPELAAVFGWAEEFVEDGQSAAGQRCRTSPAHLPSAMLIRRHAFDQLGGYQTRWRLAEVVDFCIRLREAGLRFTTLDRIVYRRRLHSHNLGRLRRSEQQAYLGVVAEALARRRARPGARAGSPAAPVVARQRPSTVVAGPGFLGFRGGLFNPGAVATADGGVLLLCKGQVRHWLDAVGRHHQDYMVGAPVLIRLDPDLRPIGAAIVALAGYGLGATSAIEDFRLFRAGKEIWVNHYVVETVRTPERTGFASARIVLGRLDPATATLSWIGPPRVDVELQRLEKNWVFVEQADRLHLFYGLRPYRVLRAQRDGRFETVVAVDPGRLLGDVGGFGTLTSFSTNPVVYDESHFLALIHQVDASGFGRRYHHWALLMDRSTLLPVRIGRVPLLSGVRARGRVPGILYAMAVMLRGDEVVVFQGEGDSEVAYTRLRRADLDRDWIDLGPMAPI